MTESSSWMMHMDLTNLRFVIERFDDMDGVGGIAKRPHVAGNLSFD